MVIRRCMSLQTTRCVSRATTIRGRKRRILLTAATTAPARLNGCPCSMRCRASFTHLGTTRLLMEMPCLPPWMVGAARNGAVRVIACRVTRPRLRGPPKSQARNPARLVTGPTARDEGGMRGAPLSVALGGHML
jgi:hypothetical protein